MDIIQLNQCRQNQAQNCESNQLRFQKRNQDNKNKINDKNQKTIEKKKNTLQYQNNEDQLKLNNNLQIKSYNNLDLNLKFFKKSHIEGNQVFHLYIKKKKINLKIPSQKNVHFSKLFAIQFYWRQFREYLAIKIDTIQSTVNSLLKAQNYKKEDFISPSIEENFEEQMANFMKVKGITIASLVNLKKTNEDIKIDIDTSSLRRINFKQFDKITIKNPHNSSRESRFPILSMGQYDRKNKENFLIENLNSNQICENNIIKNNNEESFQSFSNIIIPQTILSKMKDVLLNEIRKSVCRQVKTKTGFKTMKEYLNSLTDLNKLILQLNYNSKKKGSGQQFFFSIIRQYYYLPKLPNIQNYNQFALKYIQSKNLDYFNIELDFIIYTLNRLNVIDIDQKLISSMKKDDVIQKSQKKSLEDTYYNTIYSNKFDNYYLKVFQSNYFLRNNQKNCPVIQSKIDQNNSDQIDNYKIKYTNLQMNDYLLTIKDLESDIYSLQINSEGYKLPFDLVNNICINHFTVLQSYGIKNTDQNFHNSKQENQSGNDVIINVDKLVKLQTIEQLYPTQNQKLDQDIHKRIILEIYNKYNLCRNKINELETINKNSIIKQSKNFVEQKNFNEYEDLSDDD